MAQNKRPGGPYIVPIKSDGTNAVESTTGGRGFYTLSSSTTYYVPLGAAGALVHSVHIEGDASVILTSVTVEDSNHGENEASIYSSTTGQWIRENPSTAYVAVVGTGWAQTASALEVTAAGGNAGGAMIHLGNSGASRTRLKVSVGGTGGAVRFSANGKA